MPTTAPEHTLAHLRDTLLASWTDYGIDISQTINNLAFSFDETTDSLANLFEQWKDQEFVVVSQVLNPDALYVIPTKEEKLSTTPTLSEDLIWKIKM